MYKVVLLSEAAKSYRRLFKIDKRLFDRICRSLKALAEDPFLGKPLKDSLKGKYSLRVGMYRILYMIAKQEIIIYVLDIGHRRDVYR